MSRFGAWTRKELREQRWTFVGLGSAVAVLTTLAFVVVPAELDVRTLDLFPGLAVALATLVLGLDAFARESRRGTHALILRTPGARRAAFPAKLVVFLLGAAMAVLIEEALRRGLSAAMGIPYATEVRYRTDGTSWTDVRRMTPAYAFGIRMSVFATLLALAVGVWHVVGSVISPRAGVGGLLGVFGLAVLGVPIALLYRWHEWWFRLPTHEAYGWLAGVFLAGVAVGAVGWLSGRRFLVPRRRAAMHAALAGLCLSGLATGATALAIDRWETPDANVPELVIDNDMFGRALLGTGGRYLYVTTSRGAIPVCDCHTPIGEAPPRWSPPSAWTIDLARDAAVEDVRYDAVFDAPPTHESDRHPEGPYVPTPVVFRLEGAWSDHSDAGYAWIDTESNRTVSTASEWTIDARTIPLARAVAKATTPVRDSTGRRVWMLHGYFEREGDEDRVPVPYVRSPIAAYVKNGSVVLGVLGWTGPWRTPGSEGDLSRLDPDSMESRALSEHRISWIEDSRLPPPPKGATGIDRSRGMYPRVLDAGHSVDGYAPTRSGDDAHAEAYSEWWIVDHATGDVRSIEGPRISNRFGGYHVIDVGTLLVRESADAAPPPDDGPTRLTLWHPITGERRALTSSNPALLSPGTINPMVRLPDGRWLFALLEFADPRTVRARAFAILDPKTAVLAPLTGWSTRDLDAIAVDVDGSFLAIEDGRRVVRFSGEGTKRTVVWPK